MLVLIIIWAHIVGPYNWAFIVGSYNLALIFGPIFGLLLLASISHAGAIGNRSEFTNQPKLQRLHVYTCEEVISILRWWHVQAKELHPSSTQFVTENIEDQGGDRQRILQRTNPSFTASFSLQHQQSIAVFEVSC